MFAPLQGHPEYPAIIKSIEDNFWEDQRKLKDGLEDKGLLLLSGIPLYLHRVISGKN